MCASDSAGSTRSAGAPATPAIRRIAAQMALGACVLLALFGIARGGTSSRIGVVPAPSAHPHSRLARGKFLVANRSLQDPTFAEAVVLLVDYDDNGALGVVVNRPTEVPLTAALPEVKELRKRKDLIFLGGPVARDRMVLLVRSAAAPPQSVQVFERVYATGSLSALRRTLGRNESVRAYAGYAGWGPGQLEAEVGRGDWLIGPADSSAIFDQPPTDMWSRYLERFTGNWASASPIEPTDYAN
jgi:putative transcriptional regulator